MLGRPLTVLRRAARRLCRRGVILAYHRVTDPVSDPQMLCVRPTHFADHLAHVRETYRPTSLRDLTNARREGIRHGSVAITFDDGYADSFYHARPLLEKADVPATVFVTSGMVGSAKEFWWDDVERLVLDDRGGTGDLRLIVAGVEHRWLVDTPAARHSCYEDIHRRVKLLTQAEREQTLDALAEWAGRGLAARASYRVLTAAEVHAMAAGRLIEIGAHSVTHPVLPALPRDAQREEIEGSRRQLEQICGQPVTSFAYPYGQATIETRRLVREAGFAVGCATVARPLTRFSDPFQVPRLLVRDWDRERFARELHTAFGT